MRRPPSVGREIDRSGAQPGIGERLEQGHRTAAEVVGVHVHERVAQGPADPAARTAPNELPYSTSRAHPCGTRRGVGISCTSPWAPVAIDARQTGVRDGNTDSGGVFRPRDRAERRGATAAIAASSMTGVSPSMTTRMSGRGVILPANKGPRTLPAAPGTTRRERGIAVTSTKPTTGISASAATTIPAAASRKAVPPTVAPRRFAPRTTAAAEIAPTTPPSDTAAGADPARDQQACDDADRNRACQRQDEAKAHSRQEAREQDPCAEAEPDRDSDLVPVTHRCKV